MENAPAAQKRGAKGRPGAGPTRARWTGAGGASVGCTCGRELRGGAWGETTRRGPCGAARMAWARGCVGRAGERGDERNGKRSYMRMAAPRREGAGTHFKRHNHHLRGPHTGRCCGRGTGRRPGAFQITRPLPAAAATSCHHSAAAAGCHCRCLRAPPPLPSVISTVY